jgi:mannose-6-phosphate isomerase-like protein (cupin superfamily)
MSKSEVISENKNYKAIDIGPMDRLSEQEFFHPKFNRTDRGRIFTGALMNSTGAEISFREMPPDTKVPFLHKHHEHEEIYVFLNGSGRFQVDGDIFPVKGGSIVRIAPDGDRALCSDPGAPLRYMCIQATAGTLNGYDVADGFRTDGSVLL